MAFTNTIFYKALLESYRKFKTHKLHLAGTALVDMIFFILLVLLFTFFYEKLLTYVLSIYQLLGELPVGATDDAALRNFVQSFDITVFQAEYAIFVKLIVEMLVVVFALWVVFHTITWKRTHHILTKEMTFGHVFKKFSLINLFWAVLFIVFFYVSLKISVSSLSSLQQLPFVPDGTLKILFFAVFAVLVYFLLVSYSILDKYHVKHLLVEAFLLGCKKAHVLVPTYGLILLKFWLIHYIVREYILDRLLHISFTAQALSALLIIFVSLLVISWARLFITSVSHRLVDDMRKVDKRLERKLREEEHRIAGEVRG